MIPGKLLVSPVKEMNLSNPISWHQKVSTQTDYVPGESAGYDFNFAKHHNAGIEIRLFDYFPSEYLDSFILYLIVILEHSMHYEVSEADSAPNNSIWNNFTANAIIDGYLIDNDIATKLSSFVEYTKQLQHILGINDEKIDEASSVLDFANSLIEVIFSKYTESNYFIKLIAPNTKNAPKLTNYNQTAWEINYLLLMPLNLSFDEDIEKKSLFENLYEFYLNPEIKDDTELSPEEIIRLCDLVKKIRANIPNGLSKELFYQHLMTYKNKIFGWNKIN
jgi:hypothetical protein